MRDIKEFNSFLIKEAVGLAEPSIIYSDFLLSEISDFIELFIDSNDKKFNQVKIYDIGETELIDNKLWPDYPVSKIKISYDFSRLTEEELIKKFPNTKQRYLTTGACYNLTQKESEESSYLLPAIDDRSENSIYLKMELGVILIDNFKSIENIQQQKEDLIVEIESTIIHELNHAYESYKRLIGGSGQYSTDLIYALDINRSRIKKEIFKEWSNDIGYFLYWSEKHEMNAMVQESWPYVKRYTPNEMMDKCPAWKYSKRMRNFSATDFKDKMVKLINLHYPEAIPEILLNRLKNGLANYLDIQRESSIIEFEDSPSLTGDKIRRMNIDQFLNFCQSRINSSGEKIQRKILKLYSVKKLDSII